MSVFSRYIIRNITVAALFVAITLSAVVLLTQSLRFLELVIESGASSIVFWQLTMLALPRFLEVILPLALTVGVVFVYVKMIGDSEVVVLRSSGLSAFQLSVPAIVLAFVATALLFVMTMWVSPKSLAKMQVMRQDVQSQFSLLFLKAGVFNQIGNGLTVYVRDKDERGALYGIVIHDGRKSEQNPGVSSATIIAKHGVLLGTEDGFEVVVYDGSRQEYNIEKRSLSRLDFERYKIDLPQTSEITARWAEPEERTIDALLHPDLSNQSDVRNLRAFSVEVHKRFTNPFLALAFSLLACSCLLLGPYNRRGQGRRIALAVFSVVVLQGLYIAAFNTAKQDNFGLVLMYMVVIVPIVVSWFFLSRFSDPLRRRLLYGASWRARPKIAG